MENLMKKHPISFNMKIYITINVIMLFGFVAGERLDLPIPCRNTSDCTSLSKLSKEAFCYNGYCMCPTKNKHEIGNCSSIDASIHEKRTPGPLVYRICKHDQDCKFEGGFCNTTTKQCNCLKDFVPSSNKQHCVPTVQSFNSSCTDANQCLTFLANTTCHNNKCICVSGYHYVDNACWRTAELGQSCKEDQECLHVEGTSCTDNMMCACAAEMILSSNGQNCLPVVSEILEKCTESAQCTTTFQYSSCINNTCQCQEGYHYEHDMTRCFVNREIGEECANNYECFEADDYKKNVSIKSVICIDNKCTCDEHNSHKSIKCISAGSNFMASFSIIIPLIALIFSLFSR